MRSNDALEELAWWNSLTESEQEAAFVLTDEQKAQYDKVLAAMPAGRRGGPPPTL